MAIAFQGELGAYSEAALQRRFGDAERLPCASFEALFLAVVSERATAGVVPIENSLAGSVLENYDLLLAHHLTIIGEVLLPVRHCLLARPGTRLADVRRAYSHPQALAQSLPFLRSHGIEAVAAYDTAGAARELAGRNEVGAAAVASARAADIYGLEILAEGIQSRLDNTTRFFVVARRRPTGLPAQKASLVFAAPNAPGSLYACLGHFAARGLDLTKIESRPTRDTPWEYHFYVDVVGDLSQERLDDLLMALKASAEDVRLLGAYPLESAQEPLSGP
jgi:prephenate dehydratase